MSIPPSILPAKRRVHRKRRNVDQTAVGPLMVIAVENVEFPGDDGSIDLIFNTTEAAALADVSAADVGKWWARYNGQRYAGATIDKLSYNTIRIGFNIQFGEEGADVVNYLNDPSDIGDNNHRKLGAFENFPI